MKFAYQLAMKNIKRKPFRSAAMVLIVMFLALTIFTGTYAIISLQKGLASYQARLGADIIVVPASAAGHGTVDDILLQGITGNYYMAKKECEKVRATEGIADISTQFFLTSAKASCCSTRVQIIGFDPETDFSITPWINESYSGSIEDGDLIVGSKINVPADRMITFYGQEYHVTAQLKETGTGLDSAVYTNMNTIQKMAENAANLLSTSPFEGVDVNTAASAILLRVEDGYEISDVTDDINIHITKVQATSTRSMVSDIASGLDHISGIIGILVGAIWVLAVIILIITFALLSNERKKEFAVLRVMGASQKLLSQVMGVETAVVSAVGAVIGIGVAFLVIAPITSGIQNALELPFLMPNAGILALISVSAIILSMGAGILTALLFAQRITKSETGLLLKEDV